MTYNGACQREAFARASGGSRREPHAVRQKAKERCLDRLGMTGEARRHEMLGGTLARRGIEGPKGRRSGTDVRWRGAGPFGP